MQRRRPTGRANDLGVAPAIRLDASRDLAADGSALWGNGAILNDGGNTMKRDTSPRGARRRSTRRAWPVQAIALAAGLAVGAAYADPTFDPASPDVELAPGAVLTIAIGTSPQGKLLDKLVEARWTEGGGAIQRSAALNPTGDSVGIEVPSTATHCTVLQDRLTVDWENNCSLDGTELFCDSTASPVTNPIRVTVVDPLSVAPASQAISGAPGSTQRVSAQVTGGSAPYQATSSSGATVSLSSDGLSYTIPSDATANFSDTILIQGASEGDRCGGNSARIVLDVTLETDTLVLSPPTQSLGDYLPGDTVEATLSVSGGLPDYSAEILSGPDGAELSGPSPDGVVSFSYVIPADAQNGTRTVSIQVSDSGEGDTQQTATASLSFNVNAVAETLAVSPASQNLGELAPGDTAEASLRIAGGTPGYSATIASGPEEARLSGPSSDGTLTFSYPIPSNAPSGTITATITITDSGVGEAQQSAEATVTLTINASSGPALSASPSDISLSVTSLVDVSTTSTKSFSVSGGVAPYALSVVGISGDVVGRVEPARLASAGSAQYAVDIPASTQSDLDFVNEIRITDAAGGMTVVRVQANVSASNTLSTLPGLTPNQRSVARAVETLCPRLGAMSQRTAAQEDLFTQCSDMLANPHASGIPNTLEQVTNEKANAAKTAGIETGTQQMANIGSRLAALRAGAKGFDVGSLAFNVGGESLSGQQLAALAKNASGGGASADSTFGKWGFFLNGTVNFGNKDKTSNETGFDYSTTGLTAGADYRFTDDFIAGAAFGYATNNVNFDSKDGGLDTETWHIAAYATSYLTERTYVDAVVEYGWNDYDSKRNIDYQISSSLDRVNRQARASFSGTQLGASLGAGYDINEGPVAFGVYGKAAYLRVDVDDYRETNAGGLNLLMAGFDATSVTTTLGARVSRVFNTATAVLVPQARFEWEHEYDNDASTLSARFAADPTGTTFLISTDAPDRDYFRIGLGLSAVFPKGVSSYINYSTLLDKRDWTDHLIDAGVRWEFY